jgi:hypothetical protein
MKHCVLLLAVLLMVPCVAPAASLNANVKRSLNSEISSINLANASFADALDYLRDITGANINVNWRLLETAHVTRDTPVNVRLRAIPMRKALSLILQEAGGGTPLTYFVDQGVIEITTQEVADSKMITRVYDVADLVVDIPDFEGPDLNLAQSTNNSTNSSNGSSGGGSSTGIFSNVGQNQSKEKTPTVEERGNDLVSVITSVIRPEVWQINGGTATIRFFRGKLIVTAPRSVQEMIGGRVE